MVDMMLMFDMRAPSFATPPRDIYATALEMAAYADEKGLERISVCEHHGQEDGFLPCTLLLCAAFAARTQRARIMTNALILPLHDPVEVAEQIAVADLVSNGRLEVIFGAGYIPSEFDMFQTSLTDRGRLLDEGLEIIMRALSGERFVKNCRPIYVRPLPLQRPHPPLYVGGGLKASAMRAARLRIGFAPLRLDLVSIYDAECHRLGHEPGRTFAMGPAFCVHLAEDPEKGWKEIMPYAAHVLTTYAKWAAEAANSSSPFEGVSSENAVRDSGLFHVLTPDQFVEFANKSEKIGDTIRVQPLIGGLPPDIGWKSLELLCTKALPRLS